MKKFIKIFIYFIIVFLMYNSGFCQELTIIANGVLKKGIEATVTGNYVRVRTGPSLKDKIITKVNKGTEVYILERDTKLTKINKYNNYWYKIKIKSSGKVGWIYGAFLKVKSPKKSVKKIIPSKKTSIKNAGNKISEYIGIIKIGEIKNSIYSNLMVYGDLNSNGKNEIIIAQPNANKKSGRYMITGYELNDNFYNKVYSLPIISRNIKEISLINNKDIPFPILVVTDERFSQLYTFDSKRKILTAKYRLNSKHIAIARGSNKNLFIIYTTQNPATDYDGTITYYITISPISIKGKRFLISGSKIKYNRALPIKKLIAFDINQDGKDEIISEIGGQKHGGGIVILSKDGDYLKQIINTGIITYNSMPFIKMWGTKINNIPALAIYSTNPSNSGNINTEFGLLLFSFTTKTLVTEAFYKVNKMLDDINNYRNIVPIPPNNSGDKFLIIDFNKNNNTYTVNKPIF